MQAFHGNEIHIATYWCSLNISTVKPLYTTMINTFPLSTTVLYTIASVASDHFTHVAVIRLIHSLSYVTHDSGHYNVTCGRCVGTEMELDMERQVLSPSQL